MYFRLLPFQVIFVYNVYTSVCLYYYLVYTPPSIKCQKFRQHAVHFLLLKPVNQKKMLCVLPTFSTFYTGGSVHTIRLSQK
jgi:hypothetical protein